MDCRRPTGYGAKTEPGATTAALGGFLARSIALNTIIDMDLDKFYAILLIGVIVFVMVERLLSG